jgi:SOS-response transcriptional repressor LexA
MTIHARLKQRREELGLTMEAVAEALNVRAWQTVQQWENGTTAPQRKRLPDVAKLYATTVEWLLTGDHAPAPTPPNAGELRKPYGFPVPLISSVRAGIWMDISDPHAPGEADRWVYTTRAVGPHAFALEIEGDSMEPDFAEGGTIVVDPDQAASAGHYVVAKQIDVQRATFKRLREDAGRTWLMPLNRQYPAIQIDSNVRIIGRVVEYQAPSKPL